MTESNLPAHRNPNPGVPMEAPAAEPGQLIAAIIALAKDPAVDVVKLTALVEMQARMEDRQAEREFARALARLAPRIPQVEKNGVIDLGAGKGKIPFSRWEDISAVIQPLLDEEGFTLSFNTKPRTGGGLIVTGKLLHRDGHSSTSEMDLPLDSGPGRNNIQAVGSTLSYGKRYCTEMLLNITRKGVDDDGRSGGAKYIKQPQVEELQQLLIATGSDIGKFLQLYGVARVENLTEDNFTAAKNMLASKQRKAKPEAEG